MSKGKQHEVSKSMTLEEIVKELAWCGLKKNRQGEGMITAF